MTDEKIDISNFLEALNTIKAYSLKLQQSGSLPSKEEAVNTGFRQATVKGYNYRKVCKNPDDDIYYSGWMDCYDWMSGNDR